MFTQFHPLVLNRAFRNLDSFFSPFCESYSQSDFPLVNIAIGEEDAFLTAELPGINPEELEITVKENQVTIKGETREKSLPDGERYLRRERKSGQFVRSFALSFKIDAEKVEARYEAGILKLTLPRAEESRKKTIKVNVD